MKIKPQYLLAFLLFGCTTMPLPSGKKDWTASFSKENGQSENILTVTQTAGGCTFPFPSNGHINYLTKISSGGDKPFLQAQIKVDGNAKFTPLDGGPPATIHLYFEEGTLTNNWWCRTQFVILPDIIGKGVITLKAPLTPDNWSSVDGKVANSSQATLDAFNRAKSKMWSAGMTFGGWSAYGHGVKINDNGKATFTLVSFGFVK